VREQARRARDGLVEVGIEREAQAVADDRLMQGSRVAGTGAGGSEAAGRASSRSARRTMASSTIAPSNAAAAPPPPPAAPTATFTRCAHRRSAALAANSAWIGAICAGWIAHLPSKPNSRAARAETATARASRSANDGPSTAAAAPIRAAANTVSCATSHRDTSSCAPRRPSAAARSA
jgi:hypothetical protein